MLNKIAGHLALAAAWSAGVTVLLSALNHSALRNLVVVALEPSIELVCRHFDVNCFTHKYSNLEVYTVNFLLWSCAILLLLSAKDLFGAWRKRRRSVVGD